MAGTPSTGGNREPVITSATITATVMAVLNMVVVLGIVQLTAEQLGATNIAVGSVVGLLLAVWARAKVIPS